MTLCRYIQTNKRTTDDNDAKTPYSIVFARQKQQNPVLDIKIVSGQQCRPRRLRKAVDVTLSSKYVSTCNHFHAKLVDSSIN